MLDASQQRSCSAIDDLGRYGAGAGRGPTATVLRARRSSRRSRGDGQVARQDGTEAPDCEHERKTGGAGGCRSRRHAQAEQRSGPRRGGDRPERACLTAGRARGSRAARSDALDEEQRVAASAAEQTPTRPRWGSRCRRSRARAAAGPRSSGRRGSVSPRRARAARTPAAVDTARARQPGGAGPDERHERERRTPIGAGAAPAAEVEPVCGIAPEERRARRRATAGRRTPARARRFPRAAPARRARARGRHEARPKPRAPPRPRPSATPPRG